MEPDWIEALRARVAAAGSQRAVAKQIGYSPTVVSQVLNGCYPGDLGQVEAAVRGALMAEAVDCPVFAEPLSRDDCVRHQRAPAPPSGADPLRRALYKACRGGCPHSRIGGGRDGV